MIKENGNNSSVDGVTLVLGGTGKTGSRVAEPIVDADDIADLARGVRKRHR